MGWGWGYGFPPFGFFFGLLAVFVIFGIIRWVFFRRYGPWGYGGPWRPGPHGWYDDPLAVLKRRLASGEITEAEYERLKELLGK